MVSTGVGLVAQRSLCACFVGVRFVRRPERGSHVSGEQLELQGYAESCVIGRKCPSDRDQSRAGRRGHVFNFVRATVRPPLAEDVGDRLIHSAQLLKHGAPLTESEADPRLRIDPRSPIWIVTVTPANRQLGHRPSPHSAGGPNELVGRKSMPVLSNRHGVAVPHWLNMHIPIPVGRDQDSSSRSSWGGCAEPDPAGQVFVRWGLEALLGQEDPGVGRGAVRRALSGANSTQEVPKRIGGRLLCHCAAKRAHQAGPAAAVRGPWNRHAVESRCRISGLRTLESGIVISMVMDLQLAFPGCGDHGPSPVRRYANGSGSSSGSISGYGKVHRSSRPLCARSSITRRTISSEISLTTIMLGES